MYYDSLAIRIDELETIFKELQSTNSRLEKEDIIKTIPKALKEDFDYVLECLAGKHKFGYKYYEVHTKKADWKPSIVRYYWTVKQILEFLQTPMIEGDLSEMNIHFFVAETLEYAKFLEPIVNRTLRLGIGPSVLPKDGLSPMLAKKYEGEIKQCSSGYFVTEKLDGNRCIARYDGNNWVFTSRNGKEMHVDFDMSGLPTEFVYDGEILSPVQVEMSEEIYKVVALNENFKGAFVQAFNITSGLINTHDKNKNLIYNIFDVMLDNSEYSDRRGILNSIRTKSKNVRILPVLKYFKTREELYDNLGEILDKVVAIGGEGIMINVGTSFYVHKRTDSLLKYKQVQTMDMEVIDYEFGTGKYEDMIGALIVKCITDDGKTITCKVGSGLSDAQRIAWAYNPDKILHKIVEIAYFSMSQDSNRLNTKNYSLRFPRLKKVREDKNTTSEY